MNKIIIVAPNHRQAEQRAKDYGLGRDDFVAVTSLEKIKGFRDMEMLYAGETWNMPDFFDILDYAMQHGIKAIKTHDPNDTQAPEEGSQ